MSLRINAGSGQRKFGGDFINVDIVPDWEPDLVADMVSLPYPDGSCSMIVSHHTLEHAILTKADEMIREWHRLLEPGGSLLIFVPDMRAIAEAWIEGRINDYIFMVNTYGAWRNSKSCDGDPYVDVHKWGYWFPSLRKKLQDSCKWSAVRPFDWRKVPDADIARDFWILGVEAIK